MPMRGGGGGGEGFNDFRFGTSIGRFSSEGKQGSERVKCYV